MAVTGDSRVGVPDGRPRHARRQRDGRRVGRWIGVTVGVLVIVVLAVAAWLALDAVRARQELQASAGLVADLEEHVRAGDRAAADAALDDLQQRSARAVDATTGPHWTLAAAMPWAGPNVDAVRTVADVVDGLATQALPGLMDATALVDPAALAPVGGRVDLAPLQAAAPVVVAADEEIQRSLERLSGVDVDALVAPVADGVTDLQKRLQDVAATTATASRAVQLLPPMLGAEGPRQYLLLVQNNAEARATGGIPGAVVLLRADQGALELVEQRAGGPLIDLPAPVLPLTDAEMALFGPDLGADIRDVTFTPDFPRTGELAAALWEQQVGGAIDGVLSIDPPALAHLLRATGPVPLPPGPVADVAGGAVTAENAVELLLNTVYLVEPDPSRHDAFFAGTAAAVFAAVVGGQAEPAAAVDAMALSASEGRLLVWSAHEQEQELLAPTVLSGALRGHHATPDGDAPILGLFVNDGNQDKMTYYLDLQVEATAASCHPDGSRTLTVTAALTNTAPDDAAALPAYVTGGGDEIPAGHMQLNVLLYAPAGGLVEDVRLPGLAPGVTSQVHDGLHVVGRTLTLPPGATQVVEYDVTTGASRGDYSIRVTPLAHAVTYPSTGQDCS